MHAAAPFLDTTTIMFAKMALAIILGGILGTERAILARQSAGTRTFGLVALGAAMFVVISNYVDSNYLGLVDFDPMHLMVGIVSGIGFIGGGLIIVRGDGVHGITTAAGLWIAAAIGMAVGFGLYAVSIFATILALIMFSGMWYVEQRFKHWFEQKIENGH
jgi:putative Mg2+ transporter-C (MgtC) family protein